VNVSQLSENVTYGIFYFIYFFFSFFWPFRTKGWSVPEALPGVS